MILLLDNKLEIIKKLTRFLQAISIDCTFLFDNYFQNWFIVSIIL